MKNRNFVYICLLIMSTFLTFQLTAQPDRQHRKGGDRMLGMLEHLKTELELSEEQLTQLEKLKTEIKEQRVALKEQEFENPEDRRASVRALMEDTKAKVDAILTDEQKELLQEKRKAQHERMKAKMDKVDKEGLHQELKNYHETNIKPVILEQRVKLESAISDDDKATLESIRSVLSDLPKPDFKGRRHKHRLKGEGMKQERPELTDEQKEARASLKELTEKYGENIEALLAELQPQQEEWKKATREIAKSYLPEREHDGEFHKRDKRNHTKREGLKGKIKGMHQARFLLLDPNAETGDVSNFIESGIGEMKIFPNPSSETNTLSYEVTQSGNVRIELRRENGTLIEVLTEDTHQAGEYNMFINTQNLNDGSYYITMIRIDANGGITSQKMIVSK